MLSLTICLIDLICPIQGDPFVSCRPFTPEDLCRPNPCGANAYCESAFPVVDKVEIQEVNNLYKTVFFPKKGKPGTDNRTGEDRPVCLCNEGYRGEKNILM